MPADKSILMIGCFDTKAEEFGFLYECLMSGGYSVVTIDTGVMENKVSFPVHYSSELVASKTGQSITSLRQKMDRGYAVEVMGQGAAIIVQELVAGQKVAGAISMGGGGGTFISLTAMQEIPFGIPKLCISTMAGKDVSRRVAGKDITLMPSIVDIAGLNNINKQVIRQAAAAVCAMAALPVQEVLANKGRIAISMFGNTNQCVVQCSALLRQEGYEIFAFHANGIGGKIMESMIREGRFDAVLDITTTELADELCGGVCSAGPNRLSAAAETGIPQVVVPGCLDMVNFNQLDTVPEKYRSRELYSWSPDVTLMRTNKAENLVLGEQLVKKLQPSKGAVTIVIPLKGISQIDKAGAVFHRPEINAVLFDTIKKSAGSIKTVEVNAHINDEIFSNLLVSELLQLIKK